MSTLTKVLYSPVLALKRRFGQKPKALIDECPPPTHVDNPCKIGSYCVKATVEAGDETFIGYSQNMNITMKTQVACDLYKTTREECSEAVLVIKGGKCTEVIFMKTRNGTIRNLSMVS